LSTLDGRRPPQSIRIWSAAAYIKGDDESERPQSQFGSAFWTRHASFALRRSDRIVLRNELDVALPDTTPVGDLHTLVLPLRHAPTCFDLAPEELAAANDLPGRLGAQISQADPSVEGFNIGANVGLVSGQTIFHCHIRLIPRRKGDIESPMGGVRGVIPEKMRY
jgi:diadenosine tetraphosphate (Ap4A) HIT family hydrolase